MDWDRLISDYLDDTLNQEQTAILFQWVGASPDNARRFAGAAFLHRRLQHRLTAMRLLQENADLTELHLRPSAGSDSPTATESTESLDMSASNLPPPPGPGRTMPPAKRWLVRGRRYPWALAAALLLIIGIVAFTLWPQHSAATLVATDNVQWGAGTSPLNQGDRLPRRPLVLDSGLIKIGFDDGNQLIIEGPARFTVANAHTVLLDQGALTATVTKLGRGLSVSTPNSRVTDLGTEFGVLASPATTRVVVFTGRVSVDGGPGRTPQELSAGKAVDVSTAGISPAPFEPAALKRAMPIPTRPLDLVDLLAGGDGTGSASGVGIDAATGRSEETQAVTIRWGEHRYLPITDHRVLDGCFIPAGRMPADSAGHVFTFPSTSNFSYGLIWLGPDIPWEGELPLVTKLPQDPPTSRVMVMHSNNGITLNLDSIRALHPQVKITGFRARVGNSYRPVAAGSKPAKPLASVHVIVNGSARFEKRAFANVDPPIDITTSLSDADHFLTLATTDGGDGNACDWVLWTTPEIMVQISRP